MNATPREKRADGLVGGLILIALGAIFLFEQQNWIHFGGFGGMWPLIVVAIGVGKLLGAGDGRRRRGGLWLVFVGLWLLANTNRFFGLTWHTSWPILLIGFGVMLTAGALFDDRRPKVEIENGN